MDAISNAVADVEVAETGRDSDADVGATALELQEFFQHASRRFAGRNADLAEDLVQEMSLAVLEYGKSEPRDLICRIALNRAMDYLKAETRRGKRYSHLASWNAVPERPKTLTDEESKAQAQAARPDWIQRLVENYLAQSPRLTL